MADIAKINGYNVKDAESRERLSTLENASSTFEKNLLGLTQQVEDLYALGEQGGLFTVTTVEDTYTARETAGGSLNIADGVSTIVKTIEGSTVKCDNLIVYPYAETTKTVNGGTFTVNEDGSITVNGTFTAQTDFILCGSNNPVSATLIAGKSYTLSGCPAGGGSDKYMITYSGSPIGIWHDYGSGVTFTPTDNTMPYHLRIRIAAEVTATNLVFKPMLNEGTTALPYQPYFKGLKNAYFKEIVSTGKNLIPYPYAETTKTAYGITFIVNADGTITANGTATDNTSFLLCNRKIKLNGIYTLGGAAGGSSTTYYMQINTDKSWHGAATNGQTETFDNEAVVSITIFIKTGITLNNFVFKPMLNFGATAEPFEPYKQSVLSLPSPVENPAYNTLNFQTGKNVSQGATKIFDGTEPWVIYTPSTGNEEAGYTVFARNMDVKGIDGTIESICNVYPYIRYGYASSTSGTCQSFGTDGKSFFIKQNQYSTIDEWKAYLAAQYAAGDPVMVRYKTAEVQSETDLNASSDRYLAWKGGSETVEEGEAKNSEYGAENTVTQEYFTITGGTANGN